MTEAIVLHLVLGADEYVNPHTYSTSVRVEETSYQYPSDFACYCDLSFGPTRNGYSAGFYNGETFLPTYDDQKLDQVCSDWVCASQPAGSPQELWNVPGSSHWFGKLNGQFLAAADDYGLDPCSGPRDYAMEFYQVVLWDTTTEPCTQYLGAGDPMNYTGSNSYIPALAPMGHNGNFDISFCALSDSLCDDAQQMSTQQCPPGVAMANTCFRPIASSISSPPPTTRNTLSSPMTSISATVGLIASLPPA